MNDSALIPKENIPYFYAGHFLKSFLFPLKKNKCRCLFVVVFFNFDLSSEFKIVTYEFGQAYFNLCGELLWSMNLQNTVQMFQPEPKTKYRLIVMLK